MILKELILESTEVEFYDDYIFVDNIKSQENYINTIIINLINKSLSL